MALLSFGATAGLAYRHDWNAEMQRQNYNEMADRQAKIDAENKAKILGEMLHYDTLSNTWDNKLNKEAAEKQISEIGKFIMQNPNWETDAGLYSQVNQMKDALTNNETVYRSMRIQQNHDALVGYIQQNPGAENDPAIQRQLTEYENYVNYGSVDGISENGKEYIFMNPDKQFDPLAVTAAAFSALAPQETYDKRGVGIGATKTEVPEAAKYSTAVGLLNGPDGWRYNNAWNALSDTDKSYYQNDPVKWIMGMGSAYTQAGVQAGTIFAPQRTGGGGGGAGGEGGGAYSPYLNDFGRLQAGGPSVFSAHVGTLLPIQDGKMFVDNPIQVKVIDANGAESWRTLTSYNGSQVEAQPTGSVSVNPAGQPIAEVRMRVPVTSELAWGDNALVESTEWGWYDDPTDVKDNPAYTNVAKVETDADGNATGYAWVKSWVPTSSDGSAIRAYDVAASGQSMANKAEGYATYALTAQERINSVVETRIAKDGRTLGRMPDGTVIDMATGLVAQ